MGLKALVARYNKKKRNKFRKLRSSSPLLKWRLVSAEAAPRHLSPPPTLPHLNLQRNSQIPTAPKNKKVLTKKKKKKEEEEEEEDEERKVSIYEVNEGVLF